MCYIKGAGQILLTGLFVALTDWNVVEGYNPLVVIRPLLLQVLDEAGDFSVKLNHHPGLETDR